MTQHKSSTMHIRHHRFGILFLLITTALAFSPTFLSFAQQTALIADHTTVEKFSSIPDSLRIKAIALRMMFRHASVGSSLNPGLECLQGTRNNCLETYPDYVYDRRNWAFQARGNSGWYGKMDDFTTEVESQLNDFDVFSFKLCYIDGLDGLQEPCGNNFDADDIRQAWEYLRDGMEALETGHPNKRFIWWTIPLTQVGQHCTDTLNALIRNYARDHGKALLDIADIEAYDPAGTHLTSAEGWERADASYCGEQNPGAQACHLSDAGALRTAKALWWLMSEIAKQSGTVGIENEATLTDGLALYPNPASDNVTLSYSLLRASPVEITVYSTLGVQLQTVLEHAAVPAGKHSATIDVSTLPRGMYVCAVRAGAQMKRLLLVRQ